MFTNKKIVIILLLISLILILYIKQLKQKEHLTNDEKIANIVGIYTNNNLIGSELIGSEAEFNKIAANTFDLTDIFNINNKDNYINNNTTQILDVDNINSNTGTINNITSEEIYGSPDNMNGKFNNIYLQNLINNNMSSNNGFFTGISNTQNIRGNNFVINNDISANSGNFTNLTAINLNSNMSGNNGTFNKIIAKNINMNNNNPINLNGKFNNINVNNINSNKLIGDIYRSNNIISSEINSEYIYGNDGNFSTISLTNLPLVQNIIVDKLINSEMCFAPNKCMTNQTNILLNRMTNPVNNYMYLPNSPNKIDNNIIWDDIRNQINPNNTPNGALRAINDTWDLSYNNIKWNNKYIYKTNTGSLYQPDGTGIEITIPPPTSDMTGDFTVLWVQTLYDKNSKGPIINYIRVYDYTNPLNIKTFGKHIIGDSIVLPLPTSGAYGSGYAKNSNITPNGSISNLEFDKFIWWPIPIDLTGNTSRKLMISCFLAADNDLVYYNSKLSTYYSGFAFSTNPWNHCPVDTFSLARRINLLDSSGETIRDLAPSIPVDDYWDEIRIPFVNSQKDKIFYLIEGNSPSKFPSISYLETKFPSISYLEIKNVSGTWIKLGNFYRSFNNPFSRHNNGKIGRIYYGAVIPKQYLPVKGTPNDNFLILRVIVPSLNPFNILTYVKEIGTHDVSPF
jgi:hypothetical protein